MAGLAGPLLASADSDGTVRLWNPVTRQPAGAPLQAGAQDVSGVAFSPDGRVLASANGEQNKPTGTSRTASGMPCLRRRNMTSWNGRSSPADGSKATTSPSTIASLGLSPARRTSRTSGNCVLTRSSRRVNSSIAPCAAVISPARGPRYQGGRGMRAGLMPGAGSSAGPGGRVPGGEGGGGWVDAGGEQQRGARWEGADGGGPAAEGSAAVIGVFAEGDRL